MRTVRFLVTRLIAVLAGVVTLVLAAPATAGAGGPTSVLLASPYADAATGLYYSDADYDRLQSLLGGPDLPAGTTRPAAAAASPYVTATWLIHDVSIWRIDRIFLIGGDVWVVSEMSGASGPLTADGMYPGETGTAAATWHRPSDPAALTALLTAHGLIPGSARTGSAGAPLTDAPVDRTGAPSSPSPTATSWLVGLGGLAAGLLLGGAVDRASMVRSAARSGPGAGPEAGPDSNPGPGPEPVRMLPIG